MVNTVATKENLAGSAIREMNACAEHDISGKAKHPSFFQTGLRSFGTMHMSVLIQNTTDHYKTDDFLILEVLIITNQDAKNHNAVHHQMTNHNIDWDTAQCFDNLPYKLFSTIHCGKSLH